MFGSRDVLAVAVVPPSYFPSAGLKAVIIMICMGKRLYQIRDHQESLAFLEKKKLEKNPIFVFFVRKNRSVMT